MHSNILSHKLHIWKNKEYSQRLAKIHNWMDFPLLLMLLAPLVVTYVLYFSSLWGQRVLLPQQHVHQHFPGVQRHSELRLSLG